MASALADASSVYDNDNDPEFVRLAAPSTLKMVEMLLAQSPKHPLAAADGVQRLHAVLIRTSSMSKARSGAADAAARRRDLKARAGKDATSAREATACAAWRSGTRGLTAKALAADPVAAPDADRC